MEENLELIWTLLFLSPQGLTVLSVSLIKLKPNALSVESTCSFMSLQVWQKELSLYYQSNFAFSES